MLVPLKQCSGIRKLSYTVDSLETGRAHPLPRRNIWLYNLTSPRTTGYIASPDRVSLTHSNEKRVLYQLRYFGYYKLTSIQVIFKCVQFGLYKTQKPKISVFIKKVILLIIFVKKARLPFIKSVLVYVTRLLVQHTHILDGFLTNCKFNEIHIQSECCVEKSTKWIFL